MLNDINILLRNGYVSAPQRTAGRVSHEVLATIFMNLEYYGYAVSAEVYHTLVASSTENVSKWWAALEPELKSVTGDDRNIGDFVVYKNFPAEVLNKSEGEYWFSQILMYWGFPNNLFTEEVKPREEMNPKERKSIMLKLASESCTQNILNSLLAQNARWKSHEAKDVLYLSSNLDVDVSKIVFKENLVNLVKSFIKSGKTLKVKTGTDVLRLGAGLSDGDISLREKVRFKSFNRSTRKFLLGMLEECSNLRDDVARRKGVWKRFLRNLHPGDYKSIYPNVCKVSDDLYNDRLKTWNSKVESLISSKDPEALKLLSTRPGEFARRLVHVLDIYGNDAINSFEKVLPKLSVSQIVTLRRHIETANTRENRVFPPKGSWRKLQIGSARSIKPSHVKALSKIMGEALSVRVPLVEFLDKRVEDIKLPNNGGDEGEYTRGTTFRIPDEVKFIRTASYWEKKGYGNTWFDNGWNFFDSKWKSVGACCWNYAHFGNNSAIFSGDPTNSKEMKGRAAQLIDLYPEKLLKQGVRYAVWNILCYSNTKFSEAEDAFAALQWGEDPQKGKLFEPSRCQLSFKLQGDYLTKYVCVLDLKTREMTYIDANLKANVSSAGSNGSILSETMPAFMEYINALPSVYDLFRESLDEKNGEGFIIYTDKDVLFDEEKSAYVFSQEGDNKYKNIDLNEVLSR